MTTNTIKSIVTLTTFALGLAVSHAQIGALPPPAPKPPAPGAPPPKLSATEQWIKNMKNPAKGVTWGADLRIRNEYGDNLESLGEPYARHEQDFFRFRARAWVTLTPAKNFEFNTRITAEPRVWMRPSFNPLVRAPQASGNNSGGDWTEGIIDIFNFKWKEAFGAPLTMTVGRQDLMLGDFYDWWLVADGTPGDGSRTFYFDAARLTLDLKEQKTTIDAIGIIQFAHNDEWLPPLNHLKRFQIDQDERGAILYVSNKSIKNTQIDGYFMYKNDRARRASGYSGDIYTLGAKVTGDITDHLRYSVEGAYQTGKRTAPTSQDISAFGVKNRLTYALKDSMNTQFRFCHEYLSGDDPTTPEMEGFDPLWARWPRWSELYIYSYGRETRNSHINNLHRFGPGITIVPIKDLAFCADYNALFALEDSPATGANAARFANGGFRGHYIQAVLKYKFSQHMAGHLWAEFVFMGDYYAQRDLMSFLRAELMFTF